MAGYKIYSAIQTVIGLFLAIGYLDMAVNFGMLEAFFGASTSAWWSTGAFIAYLIAVICILQLVKVFTVKTE